MVVDEAVALVRPSGRWVLYAAGAGRRAFGCAPGGLKQGGLEQAVACATLVAQASYGCSTCSSFAMRAGAEVPCG